MRTARQLRHDIQAMRVLFRKRADADQLVMDHAPAGSLKLAKHMGQRDAWLSACDYLGDLLMPAPVTPKRSEGDRG